MQVRIFQAVVFVFSCFGSLMSAEMKRLPNAGRQKMHKEFIPTGKSVTYLSNQYFRYPNQRVTLEFDTEPSSTVFVYCTVKLRCDRGAYGQAFINSPSPLDRFCTKGDNETKLSVMKSPQHITILLHSGKSHGSYFKCKVESLPTSRSVCHCGARLKQRRIGGISANAGEIPWQAALCRGRGRSLLPSFCSGALISESYVITAAHCVKNADLDVKVILGAVDLGSPTKTIMGLSKVTKHENFNSATLENDIAVLLLKENVAFSSTVYPVCLPRSLAGTSFTEGFLQVSWWSKSGPGWLSPTQKLQLTTAMIISTDECVKQHGKSKVIAPNTFCASTILRQSFCDGDTGGPVTYTTGLGVAYLVGIVSQGCAVGGLSAVETRVTSYMDWIDRQTGKTVCSK